MGLPEYPVELTMSGTEKDVTQLAVAGERARRGWRSFHRGKTIRTGKDLADRGLLQKIRQPGLPHGRRKAGPEHAHRARSARLIEVGPARPVPRACERLATFADPLAEDCDTIAEIAATTSARYVLVAGGRANEDALQPFVRDDAVTISHAATSTDP